MAIMLPAGTKRVPGYYVPQILYSTATPPTSATCDRLPREGDVVLCGATGFLYRYTHGTFTLLNADAPIVGEPGPSIAPSAKVRVESGNFAYSDALLNTIVEYRGDSDAWCTLPPAADIAAFDVATAAPAFTVAQMGAGRVKFRTPGGSSVDIECIEDEEEGDLYHTTAGRLAFATATLMQYNEDDGGRTLWVLTGALGPDA